MGTVVASSQRGCLSTDMADRSPSPSASSSIPPGPALALLLLGGFRTMVDTATSELAKRGHADVRANHEFAMRAIQSGAGSAVEVAEKLRITKQAAAKTIAMLETRGYVVRETDPADGRRRPLLLTPCGRDMLDQGQAILDDLRQTWAKTIGDDRLADIEKALQLIIGGSFGAIDAAVWLKNEGA